jgi:YD repeat-containing protein
LTSVTSDVGLSLSYTYDGNGRLTQVTQIDGTPVNLNTTARLSLPQ